MSIETFVATGAKELLLIFVPARVVLHIAQRSEPLGTDVTPEGLLPRVSPLVDLEVGQACKAFSAFFMMKNPCI